jgi:polyisoprenoid-binding protein YceI
MTTLETLLNDPEGAGVWNLDPDRSAVTFKIRNMWGLLNVKGRFTEFTGDGQLTGKGGVFGRLDIRAASINTGIGKRDDHLRSADFLDAGKYPDITFSATSVTLSGDSAAVAGTLTVRDQSRPVSVGGTVAAHGADEISLDAELPVNRGDHGMTFNQLGMMSLDNILAIHAVFTRA